MLELLRTNLTLTPQDSKTNVLLPFTVERPLQKLIIRFNYTPKSLSAHDEKQRLLAACIKAYGPGMTAAQKDTANFPDPANLITVSLDCGKEYLGCAHRQDPAQIHTIAAAGSSHGFLNHAITPGGWRVVLNVHAVVTATVSCTLLVEGEETDHDL